MAVCTDCGEKFKKSEMTSARGRHPVTKAPGGGALIHICTDCGKERDDLARTDEIAWRQAGRGY